MKKKVILGMVIMSLFFISCGKNSNVEGEKSEINSVQDEEKNEGIVGMEVTSTEPRVETYKDGAKPDINKLFVSEKEIPENYKDYKVEDFLTKASVIGRSTSPQYKLIDLYYYDEEKFGEIKKDDEREFNKRIESLYREVVKSEVEFNRTKNEFNLNYKKGEFLNFGEISISMNPASISNDMESLVVATIKNENKKNINFSIKETEIDKMIKKFHGKEFDFSKIESDIMKVIKELENKESDKDEYHEVSEIKDEIYKVENSILKKENGDIGIYIRISEKTDSEEE